MANAIEYPFGYMVDPDQGIGTQLLRRNWEEDRRRGVVVFPDDGLINQTTPSRSRLISRPAPPAPVAEAPAPPAPMDIGPGIAVDSAPPIYSRNLPPVAESPQAPRVPMNWGFSAGAPTWTPLATPSASHRFDKPEFIYTNPVAAQQAAAQYAARIGADVQNDASYRDYAARLNAERNANERNAQQTQFSRDALSAQQAESAANRSSAENIARTSELVRQHRQAEADFQVANRLWEIANGMAEQLNRDPANTDMKGIDRRLVTWDARLNRWVPSVGKPVPPVPPQTTPVAPVPVVQSAVPPPAPAPAPPQANSRWRLATPSWPIAEPTPVYPTVPGPSLDGWLTTDFGPRPVAVPAN